MRACLQRAVALALATALIAGCGATRRQPKDANRYACDEGRTFSVSFDQSDGSAWVRLRTHGFRLEGVDTDEVQMYALGRNTLTIGEESTTLVLSNGTRFLNCRPAPL